MSHLICENEWGEWDELEWVNESVNEVKGECDDCEWGENERIWGESMRDYEYMYMRWEHEKVNEYTYVCKNERGKEWANWPDWRNWIGNNLE